MATTTLAPDGPGWVADLIYPNGSSTTAGAPTFSNTSLVADVGNNADYLILAGGDDILYSFDESSFSLPTGWDYYAFGSFTRWKTNGLWNNDIVQIYHGINTPHTSAEYETNTRPPVTDPDAQWVNALQIPDDYTSNNIGTTYTASSAINSTVAQRGVITVSMGADGVLIWVEKVALVGLRACYPMALGSTATGAFGAVPPSNNNQVYAIIDWGTQTYNIPTKYETVNADAAPIPRFEHARMATGDSDFIDFRPGTAAAGLTYSSGWSLGATAGDFTTATSVDYDIRVKRLTISSYSHTCGVSVHSGDGTVLAGVNSSGDPEEFLSAAAMPNVFTDYNVSFTYVNTSATKAQWDDAYIRLYGQIGVGGAQSNDQVSELSITITYSTGTDDTATPAVLSMPFTLPAVTASGSSGSTTFPGEILTPITPQEVDAQAFLQTATPDQIDTPITLPVPTLGGDALRTVDMNVIADTRRGSVRFDTLDQTKVNFPTNDISNNGFVSSFGGAMWDSMDDSAGYAYSDGSTDDVEVGYGLSLMTWTDGFLNSETVTTWTPTADWEWFAMKWRLSWDVSGMTDDTLDYDHEQKHGSTIMRTDSFSTGPGNDGGLLVAAGVYDSGVTCNNEISSRQYVDRTGAGSVDGGIFQIQQIGFHFMALHLTYPQGWGTPPNSNSVSSYNRLQVTPDGFAAGGCEPLHVTTAGTYAHGFEIDGDVVWSDFSYAYVVVAQISGVRSGTNCSRIGAIVMSDDGTILAAEDAAGTYQDFTNLPVQASGVTLQEDREITFDYVNDSATKAQWQSAALCLDYTWATSHHFPRITYGNVVLIEGPDDRTIVPDEILMPITPLAPTASGNAGQATAEPAEILAPITPQAPDAGAGATPSPDEILTPYWLSDHTEAQGPATSFPDAIDVSITPLAPTVTWQQDGSPFATMVEWSVTPQPPTATQSQTGQPGQIDVPISPLALGAVRAGATVNPAALIVTIDVLGATFQISTTALPDVIQTPITPLAPQAGGGTTTSLAVLDALFHPNDPTGTSSGNPSPTFIPVGINPLAPTASATYDDTATVDVIQALLHPLSPTIVAGVSKIIRPSTILVLTTMGAVAASGGTLIPVGLISIPITTFDPALLIGETPEPATIDAILTLNAPTATAAATRTPDVIDVPVDLLGVDTETGSTAAPDQIDAPVTLPAPFTQGGISDTSTPDAIPLDMPPLEVTPNQGGAKFPDEILATFWAKTPVAFAGRSKTTTPDQIDIGFTLPAPVIKTGATAAVQAIDAIFDLPVAFLSAGSSTAPGTANLTISLGQVDVTAEFSDTTAPATIVSQYNFPSAVISGGAVADLEAIAFNVLTQAVQTQQGGGRVPDPVLWSVTPLQVQVYTFEDISATVNVATISVVIGMQVADAITFVDATIEFVIDGADGKYLTGFDWAVRSGGPAQFTGRDAGTRQNTGGQFTGGAGGTFEGS